MNAYLKIIFVILFSASLFSCERARKKVNNDIDENPVVVDSMSTSRVNVIKSEFTYLEGVMKFKLNDVTEKDTMAFLNSPNSEDIFIQFYRKDDANGIKRFYFSSQVEEEKISWEFKGFEKLLDYAPLMVSWEDYALAYYFQVTNVEEHFLKVQMGKDSYKYVELNDNLIEFYSYPEALDKLIPSAFETDTLWSDTLKTENVLLFDTLDYNCLFVSKIKGEWIYCSIYNPEDLLRDDYSDLKINEPKGWIKWRNGDSLLIQFYEKLF